MIYDATRDKDNVRWCFSSPQDALENPQIKLDRTTTYNVGPVASNIGPLVVGNFDGTMKDYGLHRQFHGEIQRLQIYGSRIGRRGALTLEHIQHKAHQENITPQEHDLLRRVRHSFAGHLRTSAP